MNVRHGLWVLLFLGAAQTAAAGPIAWLQLSRDCPVQPGEVTGGGGEPPQIVHCGGAGQFVVGKQSLSYQGGCPTLDEGVETPSAIPVEPAPRLSPAFPCSAGSCLGRTSPDRRWVAILDWPTEHGWSVAATIREASDERVDVELFDLTAAGAVDTWVPGVTDVQVLVQLCAVAEAAQTDRPLAVNLSFGRRRPAAAEGSSESGLERSIRRVLTHLVEKEGIPVVAAAGNHHELLFPASTPYVVSAGALDLAWLEQGGEPRASAQTPPTARALMPGYGLYLTGGTGVWPAPPGSSYAAAVLTGWLSGTLAGSDANRLPEGGRWTPIDTVGGLALALDGVPLPGSELAGPRRLLDRAMGEDPIPPRSTGTYATLRLDGPAMPLPERSMLYAETGNGPQPGVNPCVPCHGSGEAGMLESVLKGDPESADTVAVDLSYSGGLPPGTDLLAVLLRVGDRVYAFEGCRDPELLAAMAAGSLDGLIFTEVSGIFPPGEQASVVLVVNVGGPSYWHEVPLNLHR